MEIVTFIGQSLNQVQERLTKSLEGLTSQDVAWRPQAGANAIAEILWHVARVEDNMARQAGGLATSVWESQEWNRRINLPGAEALDDNYRFLELGLAAPGLDDLIAYLVAVHQNTLQLVRGMTPADLDRVPDSSAPGRTVGALFRHMITHKNNHHGQIDYIRGLQQREWDLPRGTGMTQK